MKYLLMLMTLLCTSFSNLYADSFLSYNAGLAHTFVPLAKERLPFIIDALEQEQADVVCLQEVWKKKDRKKIIKELSNIYPYSFATKVKQTRSKKRPTCKRADLFGEGKFVTCTMKICKGKDGDDFTDCVINKCQEELKNLKNNNRECATGLMAQVGKSTLATLATVFNPLVGAGLYSYKGSNGLILLSKKKFKNQKLVDMSDISSLTRRQALSVEVDNKQIICTHLSADLSATVPYVGSFENWQEENEAQVDRLLENQYLDKVVLLGDFNCGFEDELYDLTGALEKSCRKIMDNGFSNYFVETSPECTYCSTNSLNDGSSSSLIDHIFVKNLESRYGEYLFKETVEIKSENENLSDHFGIKLEVE